MKRSAIEKLKPLPVEKSKDKKRFVAAVAVEEIRGEEHLIVDIYRNLKKEFKEPLVRICLTDKDFGNYYHAEQSWNRNKMENVQVRDTYFLQMQTISIKPEDEELIKIFTSTYRYQNDTWMDGIQHQEDHINREKYIKRDRTRQENKQKKLEERIANMPAIPEDFYDWCETDLLRGCKYIFYKRKGRFAEFHCGCCGATYKYATEPLDTFEGQFEHIVMVPKAGAKARCEKCDEQGIYKQLGRGDEITDKRRCYMVQPYGDKGGAVVRYFEIYKTSRAGSEPYFKDVEINRSFFIPGEDKIQRDYQVYSSWEGVNLWLPNNIPGMASITVRAGRLYEGNLAELAGTELEHTGIEEFAKEYDHFEVESYMESYRRMPALEMIVKMKLTYLANRLVENDHTAWDSVNTQGQNAAEVLMVDKKKIKKLVKEKGLQYYHDLFRMEKAMGIDLSEEIEDKLQMLAINTTNLEQMLGFMSAKQIINRVMRYSGITELSDDLCGRAMGHIHQTAQTYADYISMRASLGYDMSNLIIQYPRNLQEEHYKMVVETNANEAENKVKMANEKYKAIEERYEDLCERYQYEDEEFVIRPAKNAGEIVEEGRTLHHCVGGDMYLNNHARGFSTILFLRPTAEKRVPFITVEIRGFAIKQWYGAYDKKPMQKKIDRWLNKYLKALKNGMLRQGAVERITA